VQSPPRLRHPSRLRSRDLTANTFRIYLKHYMDNAPEEAPLGRAKSSTLLIQEDLSDDEDDLQKLRTWLSDESETPTKRRHVSSQRLAETPPRPSNVHETTEQTPRAGDDRSANICERGNQPDGTILGFTLSHLRRVPELALLAQRVVDAEYKRRAHEDRKHHKELESQSSSGAPSTATRAGKPASVSSYKATTSSVRVTYMSSAAYKAGEPKAAKMKRLFRYAIRQLYDEGSIVLWDGPVRVMPLRPIPALSFSLSPSIAPQPASECQGVEKLWKVSSRVEYRDAHGDRSGALMSSVSQTGETEEDEGELSDPPEDEDAYIPLTPAYLCKLVEGAIATIQSRPPPRAANGRKTAGPAPGPTPDEIVSHLHRRDERWARVGNWAVKNALEWGREQGKVWCIGSNRWEVCG
jgi:hypothetical protein